MKLNYNRLSINETNRLKGLLIILIVFGHISQLLQQYGSLHATLYSFHVVAFFFLPFLFNKDILTIKSIKKNLKRIYIPYSIFFIISLVAFSIMQHHFDPISALKSWAIGSSHYLKIDTGLRIFWFFPALFSTILLIMLYNFLSKKLQKIYLILMLIAHISIPFIPKSTLFLFPISSYIALYLFTIGMVVKYIYEHLDYAKYSLQISILFILSLLLSYGSDFSLASAIFPDNIFNFLLQDAVMILSFFTLVLWSKSIHFFESFGRYSIAIFTIHPFIIQVVDKLYRWEGLTDGLMKFLLVITLTYLITRLIYYFKINKILYPR